MKMHVPIALSVNPVLSDRSIGNDNPVNRYCPISGRPLTIVVTSTSKEYWVPRVRVNILVNENETIKAIIDQLCFIFHRSLEMAKYKENYPCDKRSDMLMLFIKKHMRRMYSAKKDGTLVKINHYGVRNGTEFLLNYS